MQALCRVTRNAGMRSVAASSRSPRPLAVRCMASAAPPPKFMILEYKYVPDILEKRTPHRAAHLAAAQAKADAGKLVMAGAVGETPEGAVFVFKDISKEEVHKFVETDPYVVAGLVPSWTLKPYTVVVQGKL